ncbi:hypothetical protein GCM10027162_02220 [Streptomyces incanus]
MQLQAEEGVNAVGGSPLLELVESLGALATDDHAAGGPPGSKSSEEHAPGPASPA